VTDKVVRPIRGKVLRWMVPLLLSGLAIWLVLRNVEITQFVSYFTRIRWQTYLLASAAYFLSFILRAFCWHTLLRGKVSYRDAFFTMGAGYLLNHIFPFRLGEIGRAVLLEDPDHISLLEVFSSVIVERIFDVFLAAVFILSVLPRILSVEFDQSLIIIVFFLGVIGLIILFFLAKFRIQIASWLLRWGERSNFVKNWVTPKVAHALEGFSVLTDPRAFSLAFVSLALSWGFAFVQNFVIFSDLYSNPPFWWMIFVLSAGAFGAALPSAPAAVGVFEGVVIAAFALLGVGAEVAFTYAIVVHAMIFIYANLIGLIGLRLRGEAVINYFLKVIKREDLVRV